MTNRPHSIAVVGAGSWGAALAHQLRQAGSNNVWLLARSEEDCVSLRSGKIRQLPDLKPVTPFTVTQDVTTLQHADLVFVAPPISAYQEVCEQLVLNTSSDCPLVLCSKGMIADQNKNGQNKGGLFVPEYVARAVPGRPLAMLTGPSFADELLKELPTAVLAASPSSELRDMLSACFSVGALRVYQGSDIIGAAIGGAAKNVIAIAAGIIAGRGLGDNARAGLVTRGLAEIMRLALASGGRPETISGLAGLGDLILSCGSTHSRNMAFGYAIGCGAHSGSKLAEGRFAASLLVARARYHNVDMPICFAVDAIVNHQAPVEQTIGDVLARTPGDE